MWNTMGDDPTGNEPITAAQRQIFHLGYFLNKSDFVRMELYADQPPSVDSLLLIDEVVTCYEEHTSILVAEVNDICQCSNEDRKDKVDVAFSDYINDCIRETKITMSKEKK